MPRPTAWGFTNIDQPLVTTLRVTNNLLLDLTPSDTITVDRMIIHLNVFPEPGQFLIGAQAVDFGIGVCSVEAFDVANSEAIPDPSLSGEISPRGWLWSDRLSLYADEGTTNAQFLYHFPEVRADLRASRKVDRGVLFLTMHSKALFGAASSVNVTGRIGALCLT